MVWLWTLVDGSIEVLHTLEKELDRSKDAIDPCMLFLHENSMLK
jgi:hypothetical protein